jgi:hypothetical protein
MGLFKKIGGAIKKAGKAVVNTAKAGVKFLAPKIVQAAGVATNILKNVPGKVGLIAGVADKGVNIAKSAIDKIPNKKARDALGGVVNKFNNGAQSVIAKAGTAAVNLAGKAQPWVNLAGQAGGAGMKV